MIDGTEKRNPQLAFELRNSHVCEKRSNTVLKTLHFAVTGKLRQENVSINAQKLPYCKMGKY